MEVRTAATAEELAELAAGFVAAAARHAIVARGQFTIALSGGSTPWKMLQRLADQDLPWPKVHIFQVDERVAPDGDPARNLTHIQTQFLDRIAIPAGNVHSMPVSNSDLQAGVRSYIAELQTLAGKPPVLDLVHLGLGSDGHTASLVPDDDVLQQHDRDVSVSGKYQGHARMTLTYPVINRARRILWLISGEDKARMVARLLRADPDVPAGRVSQGRAVVLTDIQSFAGAKQTRKEGDQTC